MEDTGHGDLARVADGPEQEASGPVGCGRPSVLVSWALGFLGRPWARRPSDCSKRSVRVGCLAHAVGALALRADSLLSGGAGWCARGARSPACEVRARAAPVTCCRPSAPQGGGLVFPGERHLPAAVRALHRVLLRHGLRPVQLLPDGARGGPCHRAGAAGGHLGQDAAHDREGGPDLRGVGHAPGQPSWPPRWGLSLHAPPLLEVGLAPGPGWHPAHSDILIPGTQPGSPAA